jgi:gamma-glutamyl phosphate reductase
MKNLIIASAIVAASASTAFADGLRWGGATEYQVEAEKFETTFGARYTVGAVTLSPTVTAYYTQAEKFEVESVDFKASYTINENLAVYGKLEGDADFNYEEATVGVAFNF